MLVNRRTPLGPTLAVLLAAAPAAGAPEPSAPDTHAADHADEPHAPPSHDDQAELQDLVDGLGSPDDSSLGSELLLFADIPVVITGSRGEQPLNLSPVPVSVLTADDLHYGGLTNIPEALRFVPGVSVVRTNRNLYGVGVRGLNHWASERTLTLIDGRDAEIPYRAVPDWMTLPLFMEDIQRIEVVRGPGGASWGANALNGVINIITKDPLETQGVLLSSRVNEFGDTHNFARWGAAAGKWSWRLSVGYVDQKSAENAISEDTFSSDDFAQQLIVDAKAVYRASEDTTISLGMGYSGTDRNDTFPLGFDAGDERMDDLRSFLRLDHRFADGAALYLQWSGMYDDRNEPTTSHAESFSSNVDAQLTLAPIGPHTISVGGNFRWTRVELHGDPSQLEHFPGRRSIDEYAGGVFVQDRIELNERTWLDAQLRVDDNSQAQTDWSGRIALLHALDHDKRHIVRVAAARSFRSLNPEFRSAGRAGVIEVIPGYNADNESVWAIEAGYNGRLTDHLTLRVDGYYQRYQEFLGAVFTQPLPMAIFTIDNNGDADGYGVETELTLRGDHAQASLWYAYQGFSRENPSVQIRSYDPPEHSVGASARVFLGDGWTFNANYRFMDAVPFKNSPGYAEGVAASHRLDLTLAKSFADGLGEVQVGVEDLFNKTVEAEQEFGFGAAETPGRTLFVRVQLKF